MKSLLLLPALLLPVLLRAATPVRAGEPAGEAAGQPVAAPALTAETYPALKAAIAPVAGELAWREVGWRPTFGTAVAEAHRTQRPVFLWAMNGHPLACV